MSIQSRSNQYGKILEEWNIRECLGTGSSEKTSVFKIVRKDKDLEEVGALKSISLISERGKFEGLSEKRKEEYLEEVKRRLANAKEEVRIMIQLTGKTNIVDYSDWKHEEWEEENSFGCDFLIRMELLKDLRHQIEEGRIFSESEIVQIGKDICTALVICHGKNIIHRDIKPENIFFNEDGDYKLGDFGIAKILEDCPDAIANTEIGTPEYWAPEQGKGNYNALVDIYSIGIVLYELANANRLPFATSAYYNGYLLERRLKGETLPVPCNASVELAEIILKACAFEPSKRYQTAKEMLDALNSLQTSDLREVKYNHIEKKNVAGNAYDTILAGQRVPESIIIEEETVTGSKIIELLTTFAEKGNALAQEYLGECYFYGYGVEEDREVALERLRTVGREKIIIGREYHGAWSYDIKYKVENGYKETIKLILAEAEKGNPIAQGYIGECYYSGCGLEQDYKKAVRWFKLAAEQGNMMAQECLAECYFSGFGVDENVEESFRYFTMAAEQGNVLAQVQLADRYSYGYYDDIGIDYDLAVRWYLKAALRRNKVAIGELGYCMSRGYGIKKGSELEGIGVEGAITILWAEASFENNKDIQEDLGDIY